MKCPECKTPTRVLETRTDKDGTVKTRRYECFNLHRFSTREVIQPKAAAWAKAKNVAA